MYYQATIHDLREVALHASRVLRDKGLRHIVYAYITKDEPDSIKVLDWGMVEFKTDESFESYVKSIEQNTEMLYAVHAL